MKQLQLKVEKRGATGTAVARGLRREGQIPGVIYGKSGTQSISIPDPELRTLLRAVSGSASLIEVTDGADLKCLTILQDYQRHGMTDKLIHVDFHEIDHSHEMSITLPVHVTGEPEGVKNEGGILEFLSHEIDIRCLPKDLPESVTIDISDLKVGQFVHTKDLPQLPGVTYQGDPEKVIVTVSEPKISAEPTPAGEGEEAEKPAEDAKKEEESK